MPDILAILAAPGSDPGEWEGDVHTLIVHSVTPPAGQFDDGELDYDLEHPPSCKPEDGFWACDIVQAADDVGLPFALRYSGTPVTEPGTYRIRSWGRKYQTEMGDEYDGGVAAVSENENTARPAGTGRG